MLFKFWLTAPGAACSYDVCDCVVRCRAPHADWRRRLDAPRAAASRSTHAHPHIPLPAAVPLKLLGEGAHLSLSRLWHRHPSGHI